MAIQLEHFIITRFNLALFECDKFGQSVLDDRWWEHRIELFSQFTIPSLEGQSNQCFKWLILIDENTPSEWDNLLREEISALEERAQIIRCRGANSWMTGFSQHVAPETSHLLTTRIDNDDSFASDAVEFIQQVASFFISGRNMPERFIINMAHGWCWDGINAFQIDSPSNSFTTLVESVLDNVDSGPIRTIYSSAEHSRLFEEYSYTSIKTAQPKWLQVIHRRNVANNILGTKVKGGVQDRLTDLFSIDRPTFAEATQERSSPDRLIEYTPERLRQERAIGNLHISPPTHKNVSSAVSIDDDGIRLVPNVNREAFFQIENQSFDGQSRISAVCINPHQQSPKVYFRIDILRDDTTVFSKTLVLIGGRSDELEQPLPQPLHGQHGLRVSAGIQPGEKTARYAWPRLLSFNLS
jgi:Putative rhamnosyl transferase